MQVWLFAFRKRIFSKNQKKKVDCAGTKKYQQKHRINGWVTKL